MKVRRLKDILETFDEDLPIRFVDQDNNELIIQDVTETDEKDALYDNPKSLRIDFEIAFDEQVTLCE